MGAGTTYCRLVACRECAVSPVFTPAWSEKVFASENISLLKESAGVKLCGSIRLDSRCFVVGEDLAMAKSECERRIAARECSSCSTNCDIF